MSKTDKKSSLFAQYNSLLIRYPFLVNGIQSAILGGIGVIISEIISGHLQIDWLEVRTMMIINLVFNTPILLWFSKQLERMNHGILTKLFIDQLLFSPLFTAGIIGLRLYLVGEDINDIPNQVMATVPVAMKSSWLFWFPQRYLTLKYVPSSYQLLSGSLCGLVWNVIFTMILSAK